MSVDRVTARTIRQIDTADRVRNSVGSAFLATLMTLGIFEVQGGLSKPSPVSPGQETPAVATQTPELPKKPKVSAAVLAAFAGNPTLERYFKNFPGTSADLVTCKTAAEFNGDFYISIAVIGDKDEGHFTHSIPGESKATRVGTLDASKPQAVRELLIEDNWGSKIVYGVIRRLPEFIMMRSQSGKYITDHISNRGLDECLEDAGIKGLTLAPQTQTK